MIMKKGALYFIGSLLLMLFAGCVRENLPAVSNGGSGDGVILNFGLTVPDSHSVQTRVMGDVPEDPDAAKTYLESLNLYVFVFENTGAPESNYLRELVFQPKFTATPVADTDEEHVSRTLLKFSARFDGTPEKSIFHIVATSDPDFEKQLLEVSDRSELGMFSGATGIFSASGEAYWQRVEIDEPINSDNAAGISDQLSHIVLIRNFARVTVKVADGVGVSGANFILDAFVVVNSPDRGYVAAYNEKHGSNGTPAFITDSFFTLNDEDDKQNTYYTMLTNDPVSYLPAHHPQADRLYPEEKASSWASEFEASNDLSPKYLYERSLHDQHKSYVVIKGHFSDTPADYRYIKLDIGTIDPAKIDGDTGQPFGVFDNFHIIRNISYDMTILNMASRAVGHSNAESAVVSPPSNNIPTSTETRKMVDINDGVDKMEINTTTIVIVDGMDKDGNMFINADTDEIKWRYTTDFRKDPTNYTSEKVKWNYPGYDFKFDDEGKDPDGVIKSWGWSDGSKSGQDVTPVNRYTEDTPDGQNDSEVLADSWRGFKLEYNEPDYTTRTKTIRLYSPYGLTRDIYFVLRKRWEFVNNSPDIYPSNIEVYPGSYSYENGTMPYETLDEMRSHITPGKVGTTVNAELTVMFELPNDIPEALFPLDFTIGFDRQNVDNAYVGNAVVTTGPSMFEEDNINVPRMQFIKTVTWDYYNGDGRPGNDGHKIVTARFVTTTDVLATPDQESITRVRVTNKYFTQGNDSFERDANAGELDPTMRWYWNFSYQNFADYFAEHTDNGAGSLDGLSFAAHGYHVYSTYERAMVIGTGSETAPAFSFEVNPDIQESTAGCTVKIDIDGSINKEGSVPAWSSSWTRYNRIVRIIAVTNQRASVPFTDIPFNDAGTTGVGPRTCGFDRDTKSSSITLNTGEQLQKILIWSERGTGNGTIQEESTRYYSIRMTLTPTN